MENIVFIGGLFVIYVASLVLHEMGHFFAARKAGVECEYIQVGIPVLFRFYIRSTQIRVGLLPVGAWVDIPEGGSRAWKTIAFAAGPVVNFVLALVFWGVATQTGSGLAALGCLMNLSLGICNLFPIPGNDGWLVMESLLSARGITIPHRIRVGVAVAIYGALAVHVVMR